MLNKRYLSFRVIKVSSETQFNFPKTLAKRSRKCTEFHLFRGYGLIPARPKCHHHENISCISLANRLLTRNGPRSTCVDLGRVVKQRKNVCEFDLDEHERKSKQVLRVASTPKCSTCESIWPGLKRITLRPEKRSVSGRCPLMGDRRLRIWKKMVIFFYVGCL